MKKPWFKHYEKGIAHEIDMSQYNCLIDILEENCEKAGDKPAFANMGTQMTFKDVSEQSRAFAAYLVNHLGIKKGDRVAIMMPNLLQYPVALFGVLRAGCAVVNVNPLYTKSELVHLMNDSGAKAIVVLANFAHTLEKALPEINSPHIIMTQLGDMFPMIKKVVVNFVVKYVKKMVPKYQLPNTLDFKEVISKGMTLTYERPGIKQDDMAFLQYTGGTTGVSKGAVLTHGNMLANLLQLLEWTKNVVKDEAQIIITPLPLYHIFSLTANLLLFMALGSLNVLITNPRDIPGFIKELRKYRFTAITGVNTLFNALLNHPDITKVDFSKAKISIAGGMAAQRVVAEKWQAVTGYPLIEGYGLTEASPLVCANPLNVNEYTGSIGLPAPSTLVEIRNEDNEPVEPGIPGELCVKGPQIMKGYWQSEENTEKAFTPDGWLKTGDIATMDKEGFFYIVDRKKDMVIVSGFNVYPNEVEEAIMQNPGVLEVAVVGVASNETGEAVKAFIVKKDPELTEASVRKTCEEVLTRYKLPKYIEFRDELPKTNIGKILRRALRE